MIKVIGFIGKMQSGKTIGAKYLVDTQQYTRIRFADGLKKMLRDGLGIDEQYIDGDLKEAECEQLCGRTTRHGMVTLGDWGRNLIHSSLWVKRLDTQMRGLIHRGYEKFVIDDVRFINEAYWLKELNYQVQFGGFDARLIKVLRKEANNTSEHQSEVEQDDIIADATIYNDYTLPMYYESINDIVSRRFEG